MGGGRYYERLPTKKLLQQTRDGKMPKHLRIHDTQDEDHVYLCEYIHKMRIKHFEDQTLEGCSRAKVPSKGHFVGNFVLFIFKNRGQFCKLCGEDIYRIIIYCQ